MTRIILAALLLLSGRGFAASVENREIEEELRQTVENIIGAIIATNSEAFSSMVHHEASIASDQRALMFYQERLGGPYLSEAWQSVAVTMNFRCHRYKNAEGLMAVAMPIFRGRTLDIPMILVQERGEWRLLDLRL